MAASYVFGHDRGFFSFGDRCGIFNLDEHGTLVMSNTWLKEPSTKNRNDASIDERTKSRRSTDGAATNTCLVKGNERNPIIRSYHLRSRHACSAEDERPRILQPWTTDRTSSSVHARPWIRRVESKVPSHGNNGSHRTIIKWWTSLHHTKPSTAWKKRQGMNMHAEEGAHPRCNHPVGRCTSL